MISCQFKIQDRVRLKGDRSEVYPRAFGSSEGIVKRHKEDDLGHHVMIYVEWDKDHWTYNGEEDMWTFEDHFDLVEESMEDEKKPDFMDALKMLIEQHNPANDDGESEKVHQDKEEVLDIDKEYSELLDEATARARADDCEAFVVIAVSRKELSSANDPVLVPEVFSFYKTRAAGILLESQVSQLAGQSYLELAEDAIREALSGEDGR